MTRRMPAQRARRLADPAQGASGLIKMTPGQPRGQLYQHANGRLDHPAFDEDQSALD